MSNRIKNENAIIITRVSGTAQIGNTSDETQEAMAKAVASRIGAPVLRVFREMAVSGKLYMSREHLQEALAMIEAGEAKYLIFGQFDRSARDMMNVEFMYRRVCAAGGEILHGDITFENSAEGKWMRQVVASMKEYERDLIAIRTRRGRWHKVEQGINPFRAKPPYGYHLVKKVDIDRNEYPAEMAGKYVTIEAESEVVRGIFGMFVAGRLPYNQICEDLNGRGVPTPKGGAQWEVGTLKVILRSRAYVGEPQFGKTKRVWDESRVTERGMKRPYSSVAVKDASEMRSFVCEAIVDTGMWRGAQVRMEEIGAGYRSPGHRNGCISMLAGLLRCPDCGAGMTHRFSRNGKGGEYRYYRCPVGCGMRRSVSGKWAGVSCSNASMLAAGAVEECVVRLVSGLASEPERLTDAVQAYEREFLEAGGMAARRAALRVEMADLGKREAAVVRKQVEAEIEGRDTTEYDNMLREINGGRQRLRSRMEDMGPERGEEAGFTRDRQEMFLAQVRMAVDVLRSAQVPAHEKREMLKHVIERASPQPDGSVDVTFKINSALRTAGAVVPVVNSALSSFTSGTTRLLARAIGGEFTLKMAA